MTPIKRTPEQRRAILKDCVESPLSGREYAACHNIGYSTLTRWASKEGVSLAKGVKGVKNRSFLSKKNKKTPLDDLPLTNEFPFVEVTGCVVKRLPDDRSASSGNSPDSVHIERQNPSPFLGMEICLPNGVNLKIAHIPAHEFWRQAAGFVRTLS